MKLKYIPYFLFSCLLGNVIGAQEEETRELLLNTSYYMPANQVPYLKIVAQEKVGRQFVPQPGINVSVYLGEEAEENLMGKISTNAKGEGRAYIPASLKSIWDSIETMTFISVSEETKIFSPVTTELEITKARLEIDTLNEDDIRSILVKITKLENGEWIPADETDLKVMVKRSLGNLPVSSDEASYTTDSSGTIIAEFLRDSLFGDKDGNLVLLARTDEHELFGNIYAEKKVLWGESPAIQTDFFKRSLWAPRFQTPYWLLGLAYLIIGSVWGTLIYLIFQIIKIRKLGKA